MKNKEANLEDLCIRSVKFHDHSAVKHLRKYGFKFYSEFELNNCLCGKCDGISNKCEIYYTINDYCKRSNG